MIATLEVEEVAEACVIDALRNLGFTIVQPGARSTGAKVIEAWKARQRVVVHVNTTVSPAAPRSLTLEEEQTLRRRATKTGGQRVGSPGPSGLRPGVGSAGMAAAGVERLGTDEPDGSWEN